MTNPVYPAPDQIIALHDRVVAGVGGAAGLRSPDALASAWGRAEARCHYGTPDVAEIGACLALGIAKAHAFADGNKRAAYGALAMTAAMNGMTLAAPAEEVARTIIDTAAGTVDEEDLLAWLRPRIEIDPVHHRLFAYDAAGPDGPS